MNNLQGWGSGFMLGGIRETHDRIVGPHPFSILLMSVNIHFKEAGFHLTLGHIRFRADQRWHHMPLRNQMLVCISFGIFMWEQLGGNLGGS